MYMSIHYISLIGISADVGGILIASTVSINFLVLSLSAWLLVLKIYWHGTSKPPWGKSAEYCLDPVTTHTKDPPRRIKIEQMAEISRGTWPTVKSPLGLIATANVSLAFPGSLSQGSSLPSTGVLQIVLYSWYPLTTLDITNTCTISHDTWWSNKRLWFLIYCAMFLYKRTLIHCNSPKFSPANLLKLPIRQSFPSPPFCSIR